MNLAMLANTSYSEADIENFIQQRQEARKNKDFARADEIRDELGAKGIQFLDGPQGTTWKIR
jgi:cysteinyl-tRNA synthetase